ncbi:hypothetical protein CMO90_04480 [Candidatus Woesearchaeota archaeon]|nr:hypothetical protein [Candidatus Woesearchaeota archaeon]
MQRKVIQLARKTLVVSLPRKWVVKNQVEKGDSIEITEEDTKLTINTEKELKLKKIVLDTKELGHYDPLYIAYLYQEGTDEIIINYRDKEVYSEIQKKLPDLMGFEIIDQGENFVKIKNISGVLDQEFDNLLRRTFYIIEEMANSSIESIKSKNLERLKSILALENSIDKFTDVCKRSLNKKGHTKQEKTVFYYVIIRDLEKIGDFYNELIKCYIERNSSINKEIIELYEETNKFFKLFHRLFYKFDKDDATKFHKTKKKLGKKVEKLMKTAEKEELLTIFNLAGLIKMIGNLYGPYYLTTT